MTIIFVGFCEHVREIGCRCQAGSQTDPDAHCEVTLFHPVTTMAEDKECIPVFPNCRPSRLCQDTSSRFGNQKGSELTIDRGEQGDIAWTSYDATPFLPLSCPMPRGGVAWPNGSSSILKH